MITSLPFYCRSNFLLLGACYLYYYSNYPRKYKFQQNLFTTISNSFYYVQYTRFLLALFSNDFLSFSSTAKKFNSKNRFIFVQDHILNMKSILKLLGTIPKCRFLSTVPKPLNPVQEAALDEQCILVDQYDQECGFASKRDCHRIVNGHIPLHRAFSVFLFNTKDELLLQQRSSTKITFPVHFTNSCCSHPLYEIENERDTLNGVKAAACRRLSFELGIPKDQCQPKDLQYITRIRYMSKGDGTWGEHEIDYILILHKDVTVTPNPDEVETVLYIPKSKMNTFLKGLHHPITPWFDLIVQNELTNWWENLKSLEKVMNHKNIISY